MILLTASLQKKKIGKKEIYYVVLSYKDHNTGQWKTKWISTKLEVKGHKKEAAQFLSEMRIKYKDLEYISPKDDMLFSDYLKQWLEKRKADDIELSTWEGYSDHLKHVIDYFNERKTRLRNLKPYDIKQYYEYQKQYGKINKKDNTRTGLATRTIRSQKQLINAALQQAVEEEIISKNPAFGIKVSNKKNSSFRKREVFLTKEQANRLLQYLKETDNHLRPLIYITLYYGLRRSEVLGLKWNAIDFENNTITIQHTVVKHRTTVAKDKTKTTTSNRTYPILSDVLPILYDIKKNQEKNKDYFGNTYTETEYIFTWEDGRPFSPDYISKKFKSIVKQAGYPELHFHDLRHSCASLLHELGYTPKEIQDWLGHADFYTTMNIYTHIEKQKGLQNTQALDNTLTY